MTPLDEFLDSYLDLARHLDPLRHPLDAPAETYHRLGAFDPASVTAHAAALKSIANAVEDLDLAERDDEVDRTMLLETIRADLARRRQEADGTSVDPIAPLRHLQDALDELMGEDFNAEREAALRDRVAALPAFLDSQRADGRKIPVVLEGLARMEVEWVEEALDSAAERLDEAAVAPALASLAAFRDWLGASASEEADLGLGPEGTEQRLVALVPTPLGVRGTLRVLELRRAGVDRSLGKSAAELGIEQPLLYAQELRSTTAVNPEVLGDYWQDEWARVARELTTLGLPVVPAEAPAPPPEVEDAWSFAAFAVRDHAARMLDAACIAQPRAVRRMLVAPGLRAGWGRTVAALLRGTDVFGLPERRLMMSFHALLESIAAETDLMLQARLAKLDALAQRTREILSSSEPESQLLVATVAAHPFEPLAAALAHEAWQGWYAETGGDPVNFLMTALRGGGLAVHLARWANG